MIKYALRCSNEHEFEVWFKSISAFDDQQRDGRLRCPVCDDAAIEKALMAPSVVTTKAKPRTLPPADTDTATPTAAATPPKPESYVPVASATPPAQVMEMLREYRSFVEANTDDVGKNFAEEARRIHYEETEPRGIRGQATISEFRELEEEGIEVAPLPGLPEDKN
ncbi:MAG: DUF1178 family protein [Alphaproteobacteria bacterium]|nr:DUF1178 family protein [Alphaproteobacteria bacterium]